MEEQRKELEKKIYFEILTLQKNISKALELNEEKLIKSKLKLCKMNVLFLEKNIPLIFTYNMDLNSKKMFKKIVKFGLTKEILNFIKSGDI